MTLDLHQKQLEEKSQKTSFSLPNGLKQDVTCVSKVRKLVGQMQQFVHFLGIVLQSVMKA
jgi:hypothetical protein